MVVLMELNCSDAAGRCNCFLFLMCWFADARRRKHLYVGIGRLCLIAPSTSKFPRHQRYATRPTFQQSNNSDDKQRSITIDTMKVTALLCSVLVAGASAFGKFYIRRRS